MKINTGIRATALLMAAAAIAGCGGGGGGGGGFPIVGGGGGGQSTTTIPSSALSSVDTLIAYMKELIATSTQDTNQPVQLGDAVLPVDDTREPIGL